MTEAEIKALREAAEKAKNGTRAERCSIVSVQPATILSLLDALAASEAKVEKAREALADIMDGYGLNAPKYEQSENEEDDWIVATIRTTLKEITDT